METKRTPISRLGMIQCDHCGAEYSDAYQCCPFCAESNADIKDETQNVRTEARNRTRSAKTQTSGAVSSGGKRVASKNYGRTSYNKNSVGKIIAWLLSLIVIVIVVWNIVVRYAPKINNNEDEETPNQPTVSDGTLGQDTIDDESDATKPSDAEPSPPLSIDTATSFTLNKVDFSFNDRYPDPVTLKVTFFPTDATATITWISSNPDVAAVDQNGRVTYGAKRGSTTITATMANGVKQTCMVYNQMTNGIAYIPPAENSTDSMQDTTQSSNGQTTPSQPTDMATGFTLNKADFSFSDAYPDPVTLRVTFSPVGTTASITWTSSNPDVAAVDQNGRITYGAKRGSATITATMANGVNRVCMVYNQMTNGIAYLPPAEDSTNSTQDTTQSSNGQTSPSQPTDTAASFTLNKTDFSFSDSYPDPVTLKVTFSPAGTTASIIWTSSNPDVAKVDQNGRVTYGTKRGSTTITAAMANGVKQTCTVYNHITAETDDQPPVENNTESSSPSTEQIQYTLNKTDFTFFNRGESTRLTVVGYTGIVSWSSSNENVVTVSTEGVVKAVGSGKERCIITASLEDGTKLEAIARIVIS